MDSEKLNSEILKKGLKKQYLADKMGITSVALANKLSGVTEFKTSEINCLVHELKLKPRETVSIFFSTY